MPVQFNHSYYGGVSLPDDVTEQELAQIDGELTQKATRDMALRAGVDKLDQLAMGAIRPPQQARPVSVHAAAAMSPQQLSATQDRRQQGVQFQQQLDAREQEMGRREGIERQRTGAMTELQQMRQDAQERQFQQQQTASDKRFQQETKREDFRYNQEQEAQAAADAAKIERGTPWQYKGGQYVSQWDGEKWAPKTIQEPPPPQVTPKEPQYREVTYVPTEGPNAGREVKEMVEVKPGTQYPQAPAGGGSGGSGGKSPEVVASEMEKYRNQLMANSDSKLDKIDEELDAIGFIIGNLNAPENTQPAYRRRQLLIIKDEETKYRDGVLNATYPELNQEFLAQRQQAEQGGAQALPDPAGDVITYNEQGDLVKKP